MITLTCPTCKTIYKTVPDHRMGQNFLVVCDCGAELECVQVKKWLGLSSKTAITVRTYAKSK